MRTNFLQVQSNLFDLILEKIQTGELDSYNLTDSLEQAFKQASSDEEFDLLISSFLASQELSLTGQAKRPQQYELALEDFKKKHQELISSRQH